MTKCDMSNYLLPNAASLNDACAPIYFLHIPKTAGSTLNAFFHDVYNDFDICGLFPGWHELLSVPQSEIAKKKLIRGHFAAYLHKHYVGPVRYFTFLRNPIERALSHYAHVLKNPPHYYHDLARELGSFGAYLRDPRTQPTVSNFQLRNLAADFNPGELAVGLSAEQLERRELERLLDTREIGMPTDVALTIANARLEQMCFVGITEEFDRSFKLLCEMFGLPKAIEPAIRNANPGRISLSDLSAADRNLLMKLNHADIELYENAKKRFEQDWERSKFVYPAIHAFVSYAQNQEDVILNRVFSGIEAGTYVDVGANDPSGDSVTKAFYERGWSGINIEPVPSLFRALSKERTRDINLNLSAGAAPGELPLFEIPGTGLSTLSREIASRHEEMGFSVCCGTSTVDTLTNILDRYAAGEIHFLKIDVEGWEADVLRGLDLERFRPWVILVEATKPNTTVPTFADWESLIISFRYEVAHFDGLNRYYLAEERCGLMESFAVPVNVSDNFIRYSELISKSCSRNAVWELDKFRAQAKQEQQRLTDALLEKNGLITGLEAEIQASETWRILALNTVDVATVRAIQICKMLDAVAMPGSLLMKECLRGAWYAEQNSDVVAAGEEPYAHWIRSGITEGRVPSPDPFSFLMDLLEERERKLKTELEKNDREKSQLRLELESQLRASADREAAFAEQFATLQRAASDDRREYLDGAQKNMDVLGANYAERESALRFAAEERERQWEAERKEFIERERRLEDELGQQRMMVRETQELQASKQAEMERSFADQLALVYQNASAERSAIMDAAQKNLNTLNEGYARREEDLRLAAERVERQWRQVHNELLERIKALELDLATTRQQSMESSEISLQAMAERERAFAEQLATLQESASAERASLKNAYQAQVNELIKRHEAQEESLSVEIGAQRMELEQLRKAIEEGRESHAEERERAQARIDILATQLAKLEKRWIVRVLRLRNN